MYELVIFIVLSVFLECGMGIVYGVGIGYNPLIVFPAAILINFFSIIIAVRVVDRLLEWKKGFRCWLERRLARGQKLIDKYGCVGIVMGVLFPLTNAISNNGQTTWNETRQTLPRIVWCDPHCGNSVSMHRIRYLQSTTCLSFGLD